MGGDDQPPHRQYRQHRPPEIAQTRRFFPRDRSRRSAGVNGRPPAQVRPVTGSPPHRQYRQQRPPQIAPTARFSEGPPTTKQRLNPRPADQL
jgi:hypothetical protein